MADTGWLLPTDETDLADQSKTSWTDLPNVEDNNDAGTRSSRLGAGTSDTLKTFDYDAAVPSGATIDGVEVRIRAEKDNTNVATLDSVNILDGDSTAGTAKTPGQELTESWVDYDYGSDSDLWGLTLDDTDVNDIEFQVRIVVTNGTNSNPSVDHISIKIHYTPVGVAALTGEESSTAVGSVTQSHSKSISGVEI